MKTLRETAEMLNVSKSTVRRAVKELNIETMMRKNTYLISDDDVKRIEYFLRPQTASEQIKSIQTASDNAPQNKSEEIKENQTNSETRQNASETRQTASDVQMLINMLQNELDAKNKTIESLIEQNKLLTQTNAFLTKSIEDKKQDAEEISDVVDIPKAEEKKSLLKRIFNF